MEPDWSVSNAVIDLADPETVERVMPGLSEVWHATPGHPDILVAVVDGPVGSHPCLDGALLLDEDGKALPPAEIPSDHGTHVASLIFGQGGASGVTGIAPGCSGLILPVFGQEGDGSPIPCSQTTLAHAITSACNAGAHVINISGGELTPRGEANEHLQKAVRQAADRNVLIVAAAGNDGCECLHVPAALPSVLAVGALDSAGLPLDMSNWGGPLLRQGVMAPGWRLVGAAPGGGTAVRTGTSFATPLVSGVAALLLSLQLQNGMKPDPLAVRQALLASAAGGCDESPAPHCQRLLAGRLDLRKALRHLGLHAGAAPSGGASLLINAVTRKEIGMNETSSGTPTAPPVAEVAPAGEAPGVTPSCACTGSAGRPGGGRGAGISDVQASGDDDLPALQLTPPSFPSVFGSGAGARPQGAEVRPSQGGTARNCAGLTNLVFGLGELGYDFGCEARLDYFVQQMEGLANAMNPICMVRYLVGDKKIEEWVDPGSEMPPKCVPQSPGRPEDSNALLWTLNIDTTPVYAIEPDDQFAWMSYALLVRFLFEQYFEPKIKPKQGLEAVVDEAELTSSEQSKEPRVYRVAIAGRISGTTRLYNGTVVPVLKPVMRGMFNWDVNKLIKLLKPETDAAKKAIKEFLKRIYYELRNLGQSQEDRALNFAGTNAYNAGQVFKDAFKDPKNPLVLDRFEVERSPICRPDSDCWDVKMLFFNPKGIFQDARTVYRYTVDVSDVVPVTVGPLRTWQVYSDPVKSRA